VSIGQGTVDRSDASPPGHFAVVNLRAASSLAGLPQDISCRWRRHLPRAETPDGYRRPQSTSAPTVIRPMIQAMHRPCREARRYCRAHSQLNRVEQAIGACEDGRRAGIGMVCRFYSHPLAKADVDALDGRPCWSFVRRREVFVRPVHQDLIDRVGAFLALITWRSRLENCVFDNTINFVGTSHLRQTRPVNTERPFTMYKVSVDVGRSPRCGRALVGGSIQIETGQVFKVGTIRGSLRSGRWLRRSRHRCSFRVGRERPNF